MSPIVIALLIATVMVVMSGFRGGGGRLPWTVSAWFVASVTWPLVAKMAGGVFLVPLAEANIDQQSLILYGPGILMGAIVLLARLAEGRPQLSLVGCLVALIPLLALPFALTAEGATMALLAAAAFLPFCLRSATPIPSENWSRAAHTSAAVALVVFTAATLVAPTVTTEACRPDKCSLLGAALTSPLTGNGNFIGVALVILLALGVTRLRPLAAFTLLIAMVIVVEASGSRSALLTAAVVATAGVIRICSRRAALFAMQWVMLPVGLAATMVVAIFPFPPGFATGRGQLWEVARGLVAEQPVWGQGPSFWVRQPITSQFFANYGVHNLWLEIGVAGGWIAIALVGLAAIVLLVQARKTHAYLVLMLVTALTYLGILESTLQVSRLGMIPLAGLLPVAVASAIQPGRSLRASRFPAEVPHSDEQPVARDYKAGARP